MAISVHSISSDGPAPSAPHRPEAQKPEIRRYVVVEPRGIEPLTS